VAATPPPSTGGSGHGSPMSAISLSSGGSHKSPIYLSSGGTVYMGSSSSSNSPAAYRSGGDGPQDTSKMSTSERYLYESGKMGSKSDGASGKDESGRLTTGPHRNCRNYQCVYNEMSCPNRMK